MATVDGTRGKTQVMVSKVDGMEYDIEHVTEIEKTRWALEYNESYMVL